MTSVTQARAQHRKILTSKKATMAPKRRKPRTDSRGSSRTAALLSLARPGQCPNSDLVSSLKSLSDAQRRRRRRRRRVTPPPRGAAFDLSSMVWQKCCRGRGQRSRGRGEVRGGNAAAKAHKLGILLTPALETLPRCRPNSIRASSSRAAFV